MKMNIKKRLAVSNFLMLLTPVAVALTVGLVFLVIILSMMNSNGFLFAEERFYDHKEDIVNMVGECLASDSPAEELEGLVRSAGEAELRVVVEENGETLFEAGADDYIEKPFSPSVLVARVKAHIAQFRRLMENGAERSAVITVGDISVNTASHRVYKREREIELKNKEYELLVFFMTNKGILFSREDLYVKIWGMEALGDNSTVAVHINRLREKLEDDPSSPKHITTVRGAGYRFV